MSLREVASDLTKSTVIGDLPNDILHRILEKLPIKDTVVTSILSKQWLHVWSTLPHFVFDHLFFDHVGASAASIIRKILMQHTESIQGFHLISKSHTLLQSDVDQFIMFVSNHGVEKFTLDMATDWKYVLPHSIFTCSTLTDLKLSRCMLKLPVPDAQFPNLVSLQLKLFSIERPVGSNNATLILPMLETLELMCCFNVHSVNLVCPKLVNLSILTSYTITFQCFDVKSLFGRIKHLCLDGSSLKARKLINTLQFFKIKIVILSNRISNIFFCFFRS